MKKRKSSEVMSFYFHDRKDEKKFFFFLIVINEHTSMHLRCFLIIDKPFISYCLLIFWV